ncbi:MAG: Clp1/GlmU family protein [Phycisphaerae bacterium]
MSQDWAQEIANQLLNRDLMRRGACLVLGSADTGKTALVAAIAKHASLSRPVGIVDADIGQSHIGPPATVGWAIVDGPQADFSQLAIGGISFVGDIAPTGHLLQLTAAIIQCVQQSSKVAEIIIIDTPGFIYGPAAWALWWTVHRVLQPELILAVERNNELSDILGGLPGYGGLRPDEQYRSSKLELIKCPPQLPTKSPKERQNYRQNQFNKYFRHSCLYNIKLSDVAVQTCRNSSSKSLVNRLIVLSDGRGKDLAVGLITNWQRDNDIVEVRSPQLDIQQVRCLVVGDITINIADE